MSKRIVDDSSLIKVADAIRSKCGISDSLIFPDGFESAIGSINIAGEGITPSGTIQITENNKTYDVTTFADAEVNIQLEEAEEVKLQSKAVTPNADGWVVEPDTGYTGLSKVTVSGDSDLKAENIKKNVNIFGVTGTYEGSGSSSGDIVYGENIEVDSLSELHSWNKYLASGTITRTNVTDDQVANVIQSNVITVEYADKIDTSSGHLALSAVGYGTVDINDSTSANTLRGKAARFPVNGGYSYYEIPTTATIKYAGNANSATLTLSVATRVTYVSGGDQFEGIVVSEDSNAYPQNGVQDGYKYVYNGTLDSGSCDHTSVTQATPVITVDSTGKITATSTQSAGLVSAGTKTATKTDSNLVASNIKSGVTIFNVTGSYTGSGSTTSCNHTSVTQATPTISVNASTGVITASATQSAGLVSAGTKSATEQITHDNLIADNIKEGVTIFNVTGNYTGESNVFSVDEAGAVVGWSVEDVAGASYGFALQDDGYYKSQNGGIGSSAALCRVRIKVNGTYNIHIECIGSGQGSSDYGIVSHYNSDLLTTNAADTTYADVIKGSGSTEYNITKTITYQNISEDGYITIKYRKNASTNLGADCLRFKVSMELTGVKLVTKTGTTASSTFDTGLSEIVSVIFHRHPVDSTGLAHVAIIPETGVCVYSGSMHTSGSEYISNTAATPGNYVIDGGAVTWKGTSSEFSKFKTGATYTWTAVGYE